MCKPLIHRNCSINVVSFVAGNPVLRPSQTPSLNFDHISCFILELSIISMMCCTGDWTNFRSGLQLRWLFLFLLLLLLARQFQCRTHMTWPQTLLFGHDCGERSRKAMGSASAAVGQSFLHFSELATFLICACALVSCCRHPSVTHSPPLEVMSNWGVDPLCL